MSFSQYQSNKQIFARNSPGTPKSFTGIPFDEPRNVATDEELHAFSTAVARAADEGGITFDMEISPPLVRRLIRDKKVKMVPREIEWQCIDRNTNPYYDPERPRDQYLQVGTNPNFHPLLEPENDTNGYHGSRNDGTRYRKHKGRHYYPVVYYAGWDGIVISCSREWMYRRVAEKYLTKGTGDILARRDRKDGTFYKRLFFVRTYTLMSCRKNLRGYRVVPLVSDNMLGEARKLFVAAVILTTMRYSRPFGYIAQHDGEKWDNSCDMIRWIPFEDNRKKENLDPDAKHKRMYTIKRVKIDEDALDELVFYEHPKLPLQIDEDGTHCFYTPTGEFQRLRIYEYKNSSWVETRVCVARKNYLFHRLACECFIGRLLKPGETVDHRNRDRLDDSKGNLLPRSSLFQANNKSNSLFRIDGRESGVYAPKNGKHWCADVRMITPEGVTQTIRYRKFFAFKNFGGKDQALKAANDWIRKHRLKDGMVFSV